MTMSRDDSEPVSLLVPCTPLEAYRRDVRQPGLGENSGEPLASWLGVAVMLHRYADCADCEAWERSRLHAELRRLLRRSNSGDESSGESIGPDVRALADAAEDAGALHLSFAILALNESIHGADILECGRSLAQRARVARKANSLEVASNLYREVESLGRQGKLRELRARAYLGYGVLAYLRGSYPDARRSYSRAARIADALGIADVSFHAHHGLMIAAGVAGEVEKALVEGWTAFRCAFGEPEREAEMLLNLGQLLLEAGQPQASMSAFSAVLQRTTVARITLPSWGGLAVAASHSNDVRLVELAAAEIARITHRQQLPYPAVSADFDLALAYERVGRRTAAQKHRHRALASARQHGFHEFVYRAESLGEQMDVARPPHHAFTTTGLGVLEELRLLGGLETLASRS